jgi:Flp pilus assembly pilin Flp
MYTYGIEKLSKLAHRREGVEAGQASVEYALVLLGAALVATLLIGWATKTQLIGDLFDHVLSLIRGKAQ